MKTCNTCEELKPLDEFYKQPRMRDGHFNRCKLCDRVAARESMRRHRETRPAEHAEKRAVWARNARLRQYGLTTSQYDELLAEQDGKCAICGNVEAGAWGGRLPVDHDHVTGDVRGLLCHSCNGGLGQFGDDPERLLAAAAYLLSRQNVLGQAF